MQNYFDERCILPRDCQDFILIFDGRKRICIPDCPNIFSKGFDKILSVKTCIPPSNVVVDDLEIAKCNPPKIRDFINAECLN